MSKNTDIVVGPSCGQSMPRSSMAWIYIRKKNIIRLEAASEYNENGVGTCPLRTVYTHLSYPEQVREVAKWLMKIAKEMEKERNK